MTQLEVPPGGTGSRAARVPVAREPVTGADRGELVRAALARWSQELAALAGRDPLLYGSLSKGATLDLAGAAAEPREALLAGARVAVSRLYPEEPERAPAQRAAQVLAAAADDLGEERGVQCAYLAMGLATWGGHPGPRPAAPVLLRRLRVMLAATVDPDVVLQLHGEPEVNPVLLHHLRAELGVRVHPADLLDAHGLLRYPTVVDRLHDHAPAHVAEGFTIAHRAVLGCYTDAPLRLQRDVSGAGRLAEANDVLAALAGDPGAARAVRGTSASDAAGSAAAVRAPDTEALVVDLDSDQWSVFDSVLRGGHGLVHAPPGTGTTQTVAALAGALVARGGRLLVVAEKRAALDALVERLAEVGLGEAVLDARDASDPALLHALATAAQDPPHRTDDTGPATGPSTAVPGVGRHPVADLRERLGRHREVMHSPRAPWGVSVYAAQAASTGAPASARTALRLSAETMAELHGDRQASVRGALRELGELGAFSRTEADSPWWGAPVRAEDRARALAGAVDRLRAGGLLACRDASTRAALEVGLPAPQRPRHVSQLLDLLVGVRETLDCFSPDIWGAPLDDLAAATAEVSWRHRPQGGSGHVGMLARRRARRTAAELLLADAPPPAPADLHAALVAACRQLEDWQALSRDGRPPRIGATLNAALDASAAVSADLSALACDRPGLDPADLPFDELGDELARLAADQATLLSLPRVAELRALLDAAGLSPLHDALRAERADAATAVATYDHAWHRSLLTLVRARDSAYGRCNGTDLDRVLGAYRAADRAQLMGTASRIAAAHAAQAAAARERNPEQPGLVATRTRAAATGTTPAELVAAAPDVLLAAKPCWVVSPLEVARVLPAQRLFDVVVIAEAARMAVASAVPALMRAERVLAFGDDRLLPPLGRTLDTAAAEPASPPPRSIFDALAGLLPVRPLREDHRSVDERVSGFAHARWYGSALRTLPSPEPTDRLRWVHAAQAPSGEGQQDSVDAEVDRVVELVLEHAQQHPEESLGVLTLARTHAERVADRLRRTLAAHPSLVGFFAPERPERFFVKDVERSQGDTRDAVILSIGYGRRSTGRLLHRFGPLSGPDGERALAVALTRARERLTVVSSFAAGDLDPALLHAPGARAMHELLTYAAGAGPAPGDEGRGSASDLDPLEADVFQRLLSAGLPVAAGCGGRGCAVRLALHDPLRPERFVLAVETDGPAWAALPSVRERDRLRPERLEHLGWSVHRVWTSDWLRDPDGEVERVREAFDWALQRRLG